MSKSKLTFEHARNLLKLANYLNKLRPNKKVKFDMGQFCERWHTYNNHCGSVGCAVGHGPFAGIPKFEYENWWDYCSRQFGVGANFEESEAFDWMFSLYWVGVDNTPKGAAKRIMWFLEKGVPENWREQRSGKKPLCYKRGR